MRTKINADLLKYSYNRWRWFWFNKEKDVTIPHSTNGMTELGNVCNLHCNICPREYEYGKQMDIGFMPLDKAKNILDQMIEQMRPGTNFTEITKKYLPNNSSKAQAFRKLRQKNVPHKFCHNCIET